MRFIDPDGMEPMDHIFDQNGKFLKDTHKGNNILVQTNTGTMRFSAFVKSSTTGGIMGLIAKGGAIGNILNHYGKQVGVQGGIQLGINSDKKALAFTDTKNIVNVNVMNGGISETLDKYNNLSSTLDHEKFHQVDNDNGIATNDFDVHSKVYLNQMKDKSFGEASPDFQSSTASSFGQHVLNDFQSPSGSYKNVEKFQNEFNSTNAAGLKISFDLNGKGNFTISGKNFETDRIYYSPLKDGE